MQKKPNPRGLAVLLIALAALVIAVPADAQVAVYKMSFKPLRSFNLDFYDSGYFVTPLTGGTNGIKTGSFIFTITEKRPYTYTATGTGQVFSIVKSNGSTQWGIRGDNTGSGTSTDTNASSASSSYLAFGPVMGRSTFSGPTFKVKMAIPTHLKGAAVASSDESAEAESRTTDIGFASTFEWKLTLDEESTSEANTAGLDTAGTITALTNKLKSRGFDDENAAPDNSDSDGNGTDTGTPTVTIP